MLFLLLFLYQNDQLSVTFIGNVGISMSDGETTLLVDLPYRSGAFGYMEYDPVSIPTDGTVVCVITHRHSDHFDPTLFVPMSWLILGPTEVTRSLKQERVVRQELTNQIGNFSIVGLATPHGDTEHFSYIIKWRGHSLYVTGDTEDSKALLNQKNLSVAFVTPWLACKIEREGGTIDAEQKYMIHHFGDGREPDCADVMVWGQGDQFYLQAKE